ncbi:glycosyltransferase family 2 protein [Pseudomonas sp. ZM23]|uniref:Glycosyltransferase family 2 protein n=1 Tax=Pseudomonas triclosanedens TaxID=2961893 RepID=A0ABY7A2L4_9PSED|nr:glycosyltransferase family 2 protein [Pseudomonas triclosanedens]MCP8464219.1 glycosyltransferase family 2 protein [Pseudomonas triclosanedens]MCP8471353.1 glycosyltransferase family 2 protein [Pseudomonas triclosanedens]MCP8477838.1 glycosyltransferase family 2 protein [Pseudomonas triclosanedens]WAI51284.1 glycosyltransferase family 2 protein [Pseudomonas triclosanedens]
MENKPRILVFIPAYRCEAQIPRVLQQFDAKVQSWVETVIVVDNRSPDATLEAAIRQGSETLVQSEFIAWRNDDNYGLGGSHKAAMRYAVENGYDYIVVLHGDDQADIHDLIPELEAGKHQDVDCLLGARFMAGSRLQGYSFFRTFGNRVYNALFSLVVLRSIYDLGSGLNLYRVSTLREFYYKGFPDDLTFNYVMLLASYYRKQKVRFFPISWREEDQLSNVRLFRQAFKVLGLLAGYFFKRGGFLRGEMRAKPFDSYSGKIQHRQGSASR